MKKGNKVKVDFFIVGQPKSGTTALANFLSQHPDVSISNPKEPVYFATDFHEESDKYHGKQLYFHYRTPDDLYSIFSHAKTGQILGEATTSYLYSKEAAKNIYKHNPDAKIIIMLRDPVDMVHSLHMQYVNETQEDESDFEKALALEPYRKKGQNIPRRISAPSYEFYSERVKYAEQIKRFTDLFPKSQIKIILMEQFKIENAKQLKEIFEFLNVNPEVMINLSEIHASKKPRSKFINNILNTQGIKSLLHGLLGPRRYTALRDKVAGLVMKEERRQPLDPKLRIKLKNQYRNEVLKTERLLRIPLRQHWKY